MKRIAIIGASYFQNPLILKAKEMGLETHVFAWECGDVGERTADFFYPISIVHKEAIAQKCRELEVDAVATVGSDLGNVTVAYVANELGLTWNSLDCVAKSTDKHLMRVSFEEHGDPSPISLRIDECTDLSLLDVPYPAIVKPSDRSGSRGVTKIATPKELESAIDAALNASLAGVALVEEYVDGREFSVESISWKGEHSILAITEKFTTGAPHFIETGHLEPARITSQEAEKIRTIAVHALDSLEVKYGASHTELKIRPDGEIKIIEIGSRMGGDCIGSDLVQLSTGYDFVRAVIQVALGEAPGPVGALNSNSAMVRFIFTKNDLDSLEQAKRKQPGLLRFVSPMHKADGEIVDSSMRLGFYIMSAAKLDDLVPYLPTATNPTIATAQIKLMKKASHTHTHTHTDSCRPCRASSGRARHRNRAPYSRFRRVHRGTFSPDRLVWRTAPASRCASR